jgi:hypothetical protein
MNRRDDWPSEAAAAAVMAGLAGTIFVVSSGVTLVARASFKTRSPVLFAALTIWALSIIAAVITPSEVILWILGVSTICLPAVAKIEEVRYDSRSRDALEDNPLSALTNWWDD